MTTVVDRQATRAVYRVTIYREDNVWVAEVDDVALSAHLPTPGVAHNNITDAVRFEDLWTEVPDFIASMTDSEPADFDVDFHILSPDKGQDVTEAVLAVLDAEQRLRALTESRDSLRIAVIARLREVGLANRVIGDMLGLSHQRIAQLVGK
jgi:hypothetical protein